VARREVLANHKGVLTSERFLSPNIMRAIFLLLLPIALSCGVFAVSVSGQEAQPSQPSQPATQPQDLASPPPSAPPQRSAADLEKLVGPIALFPDPLIAVMLPAACYPLEIVQAARFVADTNNIPKIDDQSWDDNVKAVAKVPAALKKMNDDLDWTSDLGQAFLDQQKDVMDMIQTLRNKASQAGTLQTSPEQTVVVTNAVVEQNTGTQVAYVTNQVVQIQPSNPEVIYVPQYIPSAVYYPPPAYVPNPVAPLVSFGVGMAVGAVIANNSCDWGHGGIYVGGGWGGYHGGYHGNANINANINRNVNVNQNFNATANRTQWKPDSNRLRSSGAPGAASGYQSREARGYPAANRQASVNNAATRPTASPGTTPRANTARQNVTPPANRPNPSAQRQANAPAQRQANAAASRPAASSSGQSAFSGVNKGGAAAQNMSQRGAASRSTATGAAPRAGGGGAGRGGGGGGGRRR
jgi:hypothetical protein